MNDKKQLNRLWIVTELFYPDQTSTSYILSKVANKMLEKYDVGVITCDSLYQKNEETKKSYFEIDKRIDIFRVRTKNFNKNKLIQRSIRLVTITVKLTVALLRRAKKNDKVLIVTNPAPLLIVSKWIKKVKKIELTILVHDVFPENTIPPRIIKSKNSPVYKILSFLFNNAYASADKIIVLGRDMKEVVLRKISRAKTLPKIYIIENWGDTLNIVPTSGSATLEKRHGENKITIQYAGNVGRLQGLDKFIELFTESGNKNLCLDIWGDGAFKNKLKEFTLASGIGSQVTFHGNYSRDQQNEILNSTDIALVTLSDGMYGLGVPSKAYNILASAKPILFIGDLKSEIALLINDEKIGFCFSANDYNGIINFLTSLSSNNYDKLKEKGTMARRIAEKNYAEASILNKYMEIL